MNTGTAPSGSVDDVVARIERLPTSWWHVRTRIIVGIATFFDAFDALAIATVLPVLAPMWKLTGPQIGYMISAGFIGQLVGALLFGSVAARFGRMQAMIWSISLFSVMSFVCAFAWDYNSLLIARTIQGIGLGGEVPVAACYISELTRARHRGRFVLLYEMVFPIEASLASWKRSRASPRWQGTSFPSNTHQPNSMRKPTTRPKKSDAASFESFWRPGR